MDNVKLTMLGTGNAIVSHIYNTCFVVSSDNISFLVDAGGGNGILSQMDKAGISLSEIHDVFVTHAHTDHMLGVLWVIRMFIQKHIAGDCNGVLNVWSHQKVISLLKYISESTLAPKHLKNMGECIVFHTLEDRDEFNIEKFHFTAFDILSTKEKQFGFVCTLPDDRKLVCLGDEPYNPQNKELVENADWMMCEAFCKYADRDIFHPYEKHHSTALDAAVLAQQLNVKNLVLYHTEEKTIATRKRDYTLEAKTKFNGNVFVPDDLDEIIL